MFYIYIYIYIYIYNEIILSHEKNDVTTFAASWMDIEIVIPSEISQIEKDREFFGALVLRILGFHCCGPSSIPGRGTEMPQVTWCGQNKNKDRIIRQRQI